MSESQVTTLDDAAPVAVNKPSKVKSVVAATAESGEQFFNVTIHPTGDEAGSDIVEISINGYLSRLPRGVPCKVSAAVLHVLENAVVTHYKVNGDQVIERNVQRFPFSATPA